MKKRLILWIGVLLWMIVLVYVNYKPLQYSPEKLTADPDRPFDLIMGQEWKGKDVIRIDNFVQPEEFDGWTRDQVFERRKKAVGKISYLIKGTYEPSMEVWGKIEDRRPWWGMAGQLCYGPGKKSIEGPSEESRFILNPLLLLALNNSLAYISHDPFCEPIWPQPVSLEWHPREKLFNVVYNVGKFLSERKLWHNFSKSKKEISIDAQNARDFGYEFVLIDPRRSSGIRPVVESGGSYGQVYRLRDFIHRGNSCGYPGGCNNGSPYQPELDFFVKDLPGEVYVKLWKRPPPKRSAPADLVYRIILK